MSAWGNCEDSVILCVGIQWRLVRTLWGFICGNCSGFVKRYPLCYLLTALFDVVFQDVKWLGGLC